MAADDAQVRQEAHSFGQLVNKDNASFEEMAADDAEAQMEATAFDAETGNVKSTAVSSAAAISSSSLDAKDSNVSHQSIASEQKPSEQDADMTRQEIPAVVTAPNSDEEASSRFVKGSSEIGSSSTSALFMRGRQFDAQFLMD